MLISPHSFYYFCTHLLLKMDLVKQIEADQIRTDLPEFAAGDNVSVHYKIKEGDKERIQVFTSILSMLGEFVGNILSTPTPLLIFRTVKVSSSPVFLHCKTVPWNT